MFILTGGLFLCIFFFFFQAEDGIRFLVRSRGLGDVYKRQIFSIPGMGRLMYTSLVARDWPVVFPILMFGAAITVFSYILTDVIYTWADPRVKSLET